MNSPLVRAAANRLERIQAARLALLTEGHALTRQDTGVDDWITQSWQRCLTQGLRPIDAVNFDAVSAESMRRVVEASRPLVAAARPVLGQLAHAMAHTRYFAILTNADGVVIEVDGPVDRADRRASLITRIGVNLSEMAVGTTAISAALQEHHPVWLHRGEHFFNDTSAYSCAGAPVFGPQGHCVGMLDLTGVDVPERPELKHLVAQCANRIEAALVKQQPHALLMHLRWAQDGFDMGGAGPSRRNLLEFHPSESDGIIAVDAEGCVIGSNAVARQMIPALHPRAQTHCGDLFAMPWEIIFDAAMLSQPVIEVPLWSGMRLQALVMTADNENLNGASSHAERRTNASLRDVETTLIRQAVDQAKGNVAQAARALGISRATVYRKLGAPHVQTHAHDKS
jgi:transcriptional regulator of acetoin/glycerol metabolism